MSVSPLPRRPEPMAAGVYIATTADVVEVRQTDETGKLLASAERDTETMMWAVMLMPGHGRRHREVFIVPTLRAVWAIVTDPELVSILH